MHARTATGPIVALMLLFQFPDAPARAEDLPLPERNPLRVIGLPLPERNPERVAPDQTAGLPLPERNPLRTVPEADPGARRGTWPKTLPGTPPAPAILKTWTEEETAAERTRCATILSGLDAAIEPADPVRSGGCGSAAPYKLSRIGSAPAAQVSPPATVTCDMVAAMVHWVEQDVQPAARRILGAPVDRLNVISDYSCRNAMSRTSTRLSEHALANALDIRDFVTAKGEVADLKRDWGPTERDIAARIAAEKAAEAARRAAAVAAAEAAARAAKAAKDAAAKVAKVAKADIDKAAARTAKDATDDGQPPLVPMVVGEAAGAAAGRRLSRAEIRRARRDVRRVEAVSRVGGPAIAAAEAIASTARQPALPKAHGRKARRGTPKEAPSAVPSEADSPRARFLREIHAKACARFGTVLGPEANEAHRDHFHVDMAKRRYRSFCE